MMIFISIDIMKTKKYLTDNDNIFYIGLTKHIFENKNKIIICTEIL